MIVYSNYSSKRLLQLEPKKFASRSEGPKLGRRLDKILLSQPIISFNSGGVLHFLAALRRENFRLHLERYVGTSLVGQPPLMQKARRWWVLG